MWKQRGDCERPLRRQGAGPGPSEQGDWGLSVALKARFLACRTCSSRSSSKARGPLDGLAHPELRLQRGGGGLGAPEPPTLEVRLRGSSGTPLVCPRPHLPSFQARGQPCGQLSEADCDAWEGAGVLAAGPPLRASSRQQAAEEGVSDVPAPPPTKPPDGPGPRGAGLCAHPPPPNGSEGARGAGARGRRSGGARSGCKWTPIPRSSRPAAPWQAGQGPGCPP